MHMLCNLTQSDVSKLKLCWACNSVTEDQLSMLEALGSILGVDGTDKFSTVFFSKSFIVTVLHLDL